MAHAHVLGRADSVRGRSMEGLLATWYARISRADAADFEQTADMIAARMPPDAHLLEVAPGPGYLAIALAQRGGCTVEAVDISRSFVRIAAHNASRAGVTVTFRHGDVHALPYDAPRFHILICRAAFKNFARPVEALRETRRVLRPGGRALVIDLRHNATNAEIDTLVAARWQGWLTAAVVRRAFKGVLRRRAYSMDQFRRMAEQAGFSASEINRESIGFAAWLTR